MLSNWEMVASAQEAVKLHPKWGGEEFEWGPLRVLWVKGVQNIGEYIGITKPASFRKGQPFESLLSSVTVGNINKGKASMQVQSGF